MFSNKDIKDMIVPLFLEQLLLMLVGIVDTFNIAYCGEAAVSGVSLVNQLSTIFIMLFTALASGGAIVVSQYIGSGDQEKTLRSSSQLLMFSTVFALVVSLLVFIFHKQILVFFFGKVSEDVMEACVTYMKISIYSYIFLAIYNSGAALYRCMAKTNVTMYVSIVANVLNVIGNCIGIYVLHAGVAGVAWPTFISRFFSAVVITILCFKKSNTARYTMKDTCMMDYTILKKICAIALPNGIENGIFQFVKVALSSIVAMFGTYQIAANGIAQSIWSLAALMSTALGPVFITIIGQCCGANDLRQTEYYFKKLIRISLILSIAWNGIILAGTPFFMKFYQIAPETRNLVVQLVIIHNIFNGFALPLASPLGSGLRATGDVKFTMAISIVTTVCVRFVFSYVFALVFNMGVIGIAYAMCMDWVFKGFVYLYRFRSGKWKQFKII